MNTNRSTDIRSLYSLHPVFYIHFPNSSRTRRELFHVEFTINYPSWTENLGESRLKI